MECGPIKLGRQSDHLSPYLFILITKALSAMLRKEEMRGSLHGVLVARGVLGMSHLLFVDYCFCYSKPISWRGWSFVENCNFRP